MISIFIWVLVAAGAFHAAYASERTSFLIVGYLFALLQLARAESWRGAFYSGLGVGLLIAAIQLAFFWRIFSGGAIALWLVYAFWIGLFVALARLCLSEAPHAGEGIWRILDLRVGTVRFVPWVLIPFLWCGLEYFRSELYYLRFAWASPGFAFGSWPAWVPLHHVGTYGLGFLLMALACAASVLWSKSPIQGTVLLVAGMGALRLWGLASAPAPGRAPAATVRVAGVQMEFPTENEVLLRLEALLRQHPETDLIVLSEYTFGEPVPERIKKWCREHQRYLIIGGKDPAAGGNFYNTAYVISPAGEIVFRQVKSVPIQFFKDGLPAAEQRLWESPWGKIGLCICYDLSYSRVTDRLVKLGAQALIVPTMDVADWGERQHKLHARVAPVRAAEYGIPIFRLASSGISQAVDRTGRVTATAPCPGEGAVLSETVELGQAGRLPLDRWLAPVALGVTCAVMVVLALAGWRPGRPAGMSGEERSVPSDALPAEAGTPYAEMVRRCGCLALAFVIAHNCAQSALARIFPSAAKPHPDLLSTNKEMYGEWHTSDETPTGRSADFSRLNALISGRCCQWRRGVQSRLKSALRPREGNPVRGGLLMDEARQQYSPFCFAAARRYGLRTTGESCRRAAAKQKGESVGWGRVSIDRSPLTGLPPGPEGALSTDVILV